MTTEAILPAHDVTDLGLAAEGVRRIEWAEREMPVLRLIRERFERDRPLDGIRIGACLHVTTETANLMRTLKAAGADVVLAASNPLSTKDDVAAALVAEYGIAVFARRAEDRDTYYDHLKSVADTHPQITMDDGCDLVSLLHSERADQVKEVLAGTEETTTGVIRLKAMAADGALGFPVVAVNEAQTKHLFDNRYGTGQSTVDGIVRATNMLIAGRKVVITDTDHYAPGKGDARWAWKSFLRGHHPILMDFGIIDGANPPDPASGEPGSPTYAAFEAARYAMGDTLRYAQRMNLITMEPSGDLTSTGYALANPGQEYLVLQPDEAAKPFTVTLVASSYRVEWYNIGDRRTVAADPVRVQSDGDCQFIPPFAEAGQVVLYLKRVGR